ncbi:hypothetical protein KC318_g14075 [Hortaea werneckii]|nr:hypothetical protein KC334_g6886 [Hortaea werneckii]KAI7008799.1 hypothetical protein KC355_g6789 [Hortaea werneckii]KAI7653680.1 hypothetical protein KC318_g14075 [Hortaea werneckii]
MPSIDATVAWAVPVEVEVLGAHLEAYVNLQPTINALRMCHRFGKGEDVAITRLPVELLSEVENVLIEEERRKTREEWETDFQCFQLHCELRDHFDTDELQEQRRELDEEVRLDCDGECNSDSEYDEWVEGALGVYGQECNFFSKQADLFLQHFGLSIWISHVCVDGLDELDEHYLQDELGSGAETTVAYLKLPGQQQRFSRQWQFSADVNGDEEASETGCCIRLKEAKALTESEIRRFKRATDILGLQPKVHESQRAAWDNGKNETDEGLVDSKPHLTALLRSSPS